jgi:DNA replication protein DnaC
MVQGERSTRTVQQPVECPKCDGVGLVRVEVEGRWVSKACECQDAKRIAAVLSKAKIPDRYAHCTFANFKANYPGADKSLSSAHMLIRMFAEKYPMETRGILLTGSIGCGKTHLAASALKWIIKERGAEGVFCDYRELLRSIQNSYNPQVSATEMEILTPIMNAEVLILDDLGAIRPSEWVWDTVSLVLNARYNAVRTTIITTNYAVLPPGAGGMKEDTLGDRIGERMRSRLLELCRVVEMRGVDYRAGIDKKNPTPTRVK